MPVEIVGDYPPLQRVLTGSYSLDHAAGNPYSLEWGLPLRSEYEIYGPPESGKTSLGLHIGAILRPTGTILLCCLEQIDKKYVEGVVNATHFDGRVEFEPYQDTKGKWLGHAQQLTNAVNRLGNDENINVLILDSVAAVVPPAREGGIIGEGFMADRAKFMKDLTSRVEAKLMNRQTPAAFVALNHVTESLDPRNRSAVTPGGTGLKFHGAIRINLWKKEFFPKITDDEKTRTLKGFVSEGTVEKNRFGGRGRKFRIYIVPGRGVHLGMGALFDAINLKLASRSKTGTISIGDTKVARIGAFVKAAWDGQDEMFDPFRELIANFEPGLDVADIDEKEEGAEDNG